MHKFKHVLKQTMRALIVLQISIQCFAWLSLVCCEDHSIVWNLNLAAPDANNNNKALVGKNEQLRFVYNLDAEPASKFSSSLFKLDSDILKTNIDDGHLNKLEASNNEASVKVDLVSSSRQPRRFNLLSGFNFKQKASPLYLMNGTLCRFVNSLPICTTLTTTGILTSGQSSSGGGGGGGGGNPRPNTNGLIQNQGSSVQFANARSGLPLSSALVASERSGVKLSATSSMNDLIPVQPVTAPIFYAGVASRNVSMPLFDGLFRKKLFLLNKKHQQPPNWNSNPNYNNNMNNGYNNMSGGGSANGTMFNNQALPNQMFNQNQIPAQNQMYNQNQIQPNQQSNQGTRPNQRV